MNNSNRVPSVYIWTDSTLLLGIAYRPTRNYTVTSDQLIVCLKGDITTVKADGSTFSGKAFLIRAGTLINVKSLTESDDTVTAILYLSATNQTYSILKEQMQFDYNGIYYGHKDEEKLIETLRKIHQEDTAANAAYDILNEVLTPPEYRGKNITAFDPRVLKVIEKINLTARDNTPIKDLAEEVHLSESRLVKLFKQQIGIPITKYRLRYRVSVGTLYLATGHSVTESALAAGFASTAHFSKCYSAMMGIQPSTAFMRSGLLNIKIADEILARLPKKTVLHADEINADNQ